MCVGNGEEKRAGLMCLFRSTNRQNDNDTVELLDRTRIIEEKSNNKDTVWTEEGG